MTVSDAAPERSRSCCKRWARLNGRNHNGICHAVLPSTTTPSPWPPTEATDWCVGWKPHPVCAGCYEALGVDQWLGDGALSLCAKCIESMGEAGEGR